MTKKLPSAVVTLATAPRALARGPGARVTFRLTESEAEKCGLGDRWWSAFARREKLQAAKRVSFLTLGETLTKLLAHAETEKWSRRRLALKTGIPETSLRRIGSSQVDPELWLPKLQAALAKLKAS